MLKTTDLPLHETPVITPQGRHAHISYMPPSALNYLLSLYYYYKIVAYSHVRR